MHYTGGVIYFPCHRVIHDEFKVCICYKLTEKCANGTMELTQFGKWLTEEKPLGIVL